MIHCALYAPRFNNYNTFAGRHLIKDGIHERIAQETAGQKSNFRISEKMQEKMLNKNDAMSLLV